MQKSSPRSENKFVGFVPIMRTFFKESPLWTEKRAFSRAEAFIYLLYTVQFRDREVFNRGNPFTVHIGQLLTSELKLSSEWNRSRQWVKAYIAYLSESGEIKIIERNKHRLIIEFTSVFYLQEYTQQNLHQKNKAARIKTNIKNTYKNKGKTINNEKKDKNENILLKIQNTHTYDNTTE